MLKVIKNEYENGRPTGLYFPFLIIGCLLATYMGYSIDTTPRQISNEIVASSQTQMSPIVADLHVNNAPIPARKPDVPQWYKEKQFYDIAKFVIIDLEGGDQITKEPNGGLARYGINTKAHPEVNIYTLTKEQALQIAKKKYWNAVNAEKLPTNMRLVAFDTAFHHGSGTANRLIKKSGYNKYTLLNLRQQEYNRLVNANPAKYGKYKKGWSNRLAKVRQASL